MLLRGSRRSVAILSGNETTEQLNGLSDDIWAYSGLGCRNVSLIFAPDGYDLKLKMPHISTKYRNNYRQMKALLQMNGIQFEDLDIAVAVEQRNFPKLLSELAVARYRTLDEVKTWHPRLADFGRAQSPSLTDWPDGRDVLAWLTDLA